MATGAAALSPFSTEEGRQRKEVCGESRRTQPGLGSALSGAGRTLPSRGAETGNFHVRRGTGQEVEAFGRVYAFTHREWFGGGLFAVRGRGIEGHDAGEGGGRVVVDFARGREKRIRRGSFGELGGVECF